MSKSPLASVKERFESKEKLVAAVEKLAGKDLWVDRVNSTKGLGKVSNAKLLRLHAILTHAKESFGSRDKLIASIVELAKRAKDAGYALRLGAYPLPRLLDLHRSLARSSKRAAAQPPKAPKAQKPKKAAAPKAEKPAAAPKVEKAAAAAPKAAEKKSSPKAGKPAAEKPEKSTPKKPAAKKSAKSE